MKLFKAAFFICLFSPICAYAQTTQTISLGGNWALNTKIPLTFDKEEFAKRFVAQMDGVRALQAAAQTAGPALPNQAPSGKLQPLPQDPYVQDFISREKILKSASFQPIPSREWYIQKHSASACEFYKGWAKDEDMSFVNAAQERRECESSMDKKYIKHTCAICGQPINGACGAIARWNDAEGEHYAHGDCFDAQRHQIAKENLLNNLNITEDFCTQLDQQRHEREAAQQRVAAELKQASQERRLQQRQEPAVTVQPGTRSLRKVNRDIRRFTLLHGDSLQQAAKAKRQGQELSFKQKNLLQRFEMLLEEQKRALANQKAK